VSLVVDVLVVAGGVVLGRWVARRLRARFPAQSPPVAGTAPSSLRELTAFPCQLGDVVVRTAERDEAWLAGALVFEEEGPVAALFVAPEAGADRALFVRGSNPGVTWLSPLGAGEVAVTPDPPPAIEHRGVRFERTRRLPVRVTRLGSGAPSVGERAVVCEYAGPGAEQIVVVAGSEQTLAWIGVALGQADYDVLPGGKATLE
jgi:hypothetical protein